MHFVYIDDSWDQHTYVVAALCLPAVHWHEALNRLKAMRAQLRDDYGIYIRKELHAYEFTAGKGNVGPRIVTKHERSQVFRQVLRNMTTLPEARVLAAVFPKASRAIAFERLLNRINTNVSKRRGYAVLICDAGNEGSYTAMLRRLRRHNPVPSQYGRWAATGTERKNIPLERILEDPSFRDSRSSYFIQAVDFAAYALLRQERPTPRITKYGLETAFDELGPILEPQASRRDPRGIIRP